MTTTPPDINLPNETRLGPIAAAAILIGLIVAILTVWGLVGHSTPSDHTQQTATAEAEPALATTAATDHEVHEAHDDHTPKVLPPVWYIGILPFIGILGCIAVLPLLSSTHHWWENNLNRFIVSMCFAGLTMLYYLLAEGLHSLPYVMNHAIIEEYIPFIVLLFSLYVISGGIRLSGDLAAHPLTNTTFLLVGAGIASFIGTTGASMLLIRPLLNTNKERKHKVHTVVFFIFLASNIGGTLLPVGDPPLFLGFLAGVPFTWTLGLWPEWLICCIVLLIVYYIIDTRAYKREAPADVRRDDRNIEPLRLVGWFNLFWLALLVVVLALIDPTKVVPGTNWEPFLFMRELIMLGIVVIAWGTTRPQIRTDNQFNFAAIIEVAVIFIGIFIAMQVPLEVLKISGSTITNAFGEPWHFFWATGILSSFLDNAPTYLVFLQLAQQVPITEGMDTLIIAEGTAKEYVISDSHLAAISLGAVFMGAMSYIGNGPNFMVKAIAEQSGVKMPSFFGYMFRYSIPILIPLFIVISLLVEFVI
ncbi:MAG: sodium:proton antiporter [Phycisphaerales bacterium]|nr:sodium:proton antiporter [Phycisphaerales bacterium]